MFWVRVILKLRKAKEKKKQEDIIVARRDKTFNSIQ